MILLMFQFIVLLIHGVVQTGSLRCSQLYHPHVLQDGLCFVWYWQWFLDADYAAVKCSNSSTQGYQNGELAVARDLNDTAALTSLLGSKGDMGSFGPAYIGMTRDSAGCSNPFDGLTWANGSAAPQAAGWWAPSHPNSCTNEGVVLSTEGLMDVDKAVIRTYICMFPEPTVSPIGCEGGHTLDAVTDTCLYSPNELKSYDEASAYCRDLNTGTIGAELAIPNNEEELTAIADYIRNATSTASGNAHIGIHRKPDADFIANRTHEGGLFFVDGTPLQPLNYSYFLTYDTNDGCCFYWRSQTIRQTTHSRGGFGKICEFDAVKYPNECVDGDNTTAIELNGTCYKKFGVPTGLFWGAHEECSDGRHGFNGSLAMPKTEESYAAMNSLSGAAYVWVGIHLNTAPCYGAYSTLMTLAGRPLLDLQELDMGELNSCNAQIMRLSLSTSKITVSNGDGSFHFACQYKANGCELPLAPAYYGVQGFRSLSSVKYIQIAANVEGVNTIVEENTVAAKHLCLIRCTEHRLCYAITYFESGLCRLHYAPFGRKCLHAVHNSTAIMYSRK